MNVRAPFNDEEPGATLRLSPELEILEASGQLDGIVPGNALELWRKPLGKVLQPAQVGLIADLAETARKGPTAPRTMRLPDGREVLLTVQWGRDAAREGFTLKIVELGDLDFWQQDRDAAGAPSGQVDREVFLDRAARALAGDDTAVTLVEMRSPSDDGGLAAFGRIVEQEGRDSGALGTSRLDRQLFGVLHPAGDDPARLTNRIARQAVSDGLVASTDDIAAERLENDGAGLTPDEIRATLAYATSGLRARIAEGLSRIGLGARRDSAQARLKQLLKSAQQSLKSGDILTTTRPVVSLARSAVAMREVRIMPIVEGLPLDPAVVGALTDAAPFMAELDKRAIMAALDRRAEIKQWRNVSLKVAVSIRAENIEDRKFRKRIGKELASRDESAGKLLIRPWLPLSGDMSGMGGDALQRWSDQDWRIVVPDFYAFLKGDCSSRGGTGPTDDPGGYIEVPTDRLRTLASEKDGAHLISGLVAAWRAKDRELIATNCSRDDDAQFLTDVGVRYAKGPKIGSWGTD